MRRRIAFDIHGVLDSFQYMIDLMDMHGKNGDTVIVMSGQKHDDQIKDLFFDKGITFNEYYSVLGWLEQKGINITWEDGKGFADNDEWNNAKRDMCVAYKIDVIYDDSYLYRDTFDNIDTLYMHVINPKRKIYRNQDSPLLDSRITLSKEQEQVTRYMKDKP